MTTGYVAFIYCSCAAASSGLLHLNGSARGIAGLDNHAGATLALMPHPERDAWTFMHRDNDADKAAARGNAQAMLAVPRMAFFHAFAGGLAARRLPR